LIDLYEIKEKISKEYYDEVLNILLNCNLEKALIEISNLLQIYNAIGRYDDTVKLYNNYRAYIPKDNLFLANKFLNEYELATAQNILTSRPRSMLVELSTLCNLECIMCMQRERQVTTINPKFLDIAVENMPYLEKLMWQGGEVFLLPQFKDILLKTLEFPYLRQTITSNFQNIDDELLDLLTRNNINLAVSIDGSKKETYEKIRTGARFSKIINNLEKLSLYRNKNKSSLKLQINFVVMNSNFKEILGVVDIAKKYNANSIVFLQCVGKTCLDVENNKISEVKQYLEQAEQKCKSHNIIFTNLFGISSENPKRVSNYDESMKNRLNDIVFANRNKANFFCHLPWYELTFFSNNTVSVNCSCDVSYNIAVNEKTSIYDIWNSKEMVETRNIVINNDINKGCKINCGVAALEMRKPLSF